MKFRINPIALVSFAIACGLQALAQTDTPVLATPSAASSNISFIDTSIENASPLYWEFDDTGSMQVYLLYDHERDSPNRAAGHWHFRVEGKPNAKVSLVLNNFRNVWNGKPGVPVSEKSIAYISTDSKNWQVVKAKLLPPGDRVELNLELPASGSLFVARLPPYRLSDLEHFQNEIRTHPLVRFEAIGKTVQGRSLEIISLGKPNAPHRVFLRGRAHPWEPGGNWVIEGFVRRLLSGDADSLRFLDRFSVAILPLANKDGVAAGRTRFNMLGKDLNRNWDQPANEQLCPENYALEKWLERAIADGRKPHLALELHNDESGKLHVSRPDGMDHQSYLARMARFEELLREKTWFREGSTNAVFKNAGTLGEGWLVRYGITAAVHELNCNWIEGLQDYPSSKHWQLYGSQLCDVLETYFDETK